MWPPWTLSMTSLLLGTGDCSKFPLYLLWPREIGTLNSPASSPKCWNYTELDHSQLYLVLKIEPRPLHMLGKHSTDWAPSPIPERKVLNALDWWLNLSLLTLTFYIKIITDSQSWRAMSQKVLCTVYQSPTVLILLQLHFMSTQPQP